MVGCEAVVAPSAVSGAARFTAWCTGGKEYFDQHVNDDEPVALIPGVHYVVDEERLSAVDSLILIFQNLLASGICGLCSGAGAL